MSRPRRSEHIREALIATGIEQLYQAMLKKSNDPHETEHLMMECLGKMLWEAQSQNKMPDESDYLHCLKKYI